jgi:hypothetical protein
VVQGHPRQKVLEIPFPKIIRAKWTGGVVQAEFKLNATKKGGRGVV